MTKINKDFQIDQHLGASENANRTKKSLFKSKLRKLFDKTSRKFQFSNSKCKKLIDEVLEKPVEVHKDFRSFFNQILKKHYEAVTMENGSVKYIARKDQETGMDVEFLSRFKSFEGGKSILQSHSPVKVSRKKVMKLAQNFKANLKEHYVRHNLQVPKRNFARVFGLVKNPNVFSNSLNNSSFLKIKDNVLSLMKQPFVQKHRKLLSIFNVIPAKRKQRIVTSLLNSLYRLIFHDLGLKDIQNRLYFPKQSFQDVKSKTMFNLFKNKRFFEVQNLLRENPLLIYQFDHVRAASSRTDWQVRRTITHLAIKSGNLSFLKFLLSLKIDVFSYDLSGKSTIDYAITTKNPLIISVGGRRGDNGRSCWARSRRI